MNLTLEMIDALEAGPELDALVHTWVFGQEPVGEVVNGSARRVVLGRQKAGTIELVPEYSTDVKLALVVAGHIQLMLYGLDDAVHDELNLANFTLQNYYGPFGPHWVASFDTLYDEGQYRRFFYYINDEEYKDYAQEFPTTTEFSPTAELAICKAALKATLLLRQAAPHQAL